MTSIAPKIKKAGAVVEAEPAIVITVASETWRFRAYVAFWGMCFFAITMANLVVKPILLAGPPADEYNSSCPPYSRVSIMYNIYATNMSPSALGVHALGLRCFS